LIGEENNDMKIQATPIKKDISTDNHPPVEKEKRKIRLLTFHHLKNQLNQNLPNKKVMMKKKI